VSGVVLSSTGVDTIILTPTTGGVLVNGIQVVQGGTVTKLLNTKARVRAVAAVADKATVTLSAGGTSVISSAPSPTVGAYTLVDAGSLTIAGTVNGAALGSSTLDLAAGSDVTLLVNGEVSAPTVTTITDDNRLPTSSSKLKIRLVNATTGMSSYPLTLTVDYTALASSVAQATASSYSSSQSASTTATLEVTSSLSSTALYSLTDLTLSAQSVYSVFLFGDSTAASGLLRKER
jgi:hypothetical protein